MTTIEERLSRLEGVYDHLASKADVAELKTELKTDIAAMEARLVKWFAGLMIGTALGVVTATVALVKLLE